MMRRRTFLKTAAGAAVFSVGGPALAGWSLDRLPPGGIQVDEASGLPRAGLEALLDRIARETGGGWLARLATAEAGVGRPPSVLL